MINIYSAALYLSEAEGLSAWRARLPAFTKLATTDEGDLDYEKIADSAEVRRYAVLDPIPKVIELVFVREVTAQHLTQDLDGALGRQPGLDREALGEALPRFMKALDHTMARGDRLLIRTSPDHRIWLTTPAGETRLEGNAAFSRALWQIWLGNPCLQNTLRHGLLSLLGNVRDLAQGQ
jgi:hypothetical protein